VIWGPKSKIEFVWDKNLITPSSILLQFKKNYITVYGEFKTVYKKIIRRYVYPYPLFSGSGNLTVLFEFTLYAPLLL